jgi:cytosine/adenosine deaminase-related metal-dependent hydrolase
MATRNPLELLGRTPGCLRPGDPADLVLFDLSTDTAGNAATFSVRATICDGQAAFGQV